MKAAGRTAVLVGIVATVVVLRAAAFLYYALMDPATSITATHAASAPLREPPPNQ